jgi:hypothetical protein
MTQGAPQYGQYEFSDTENAVIGQTGGWVNAWGIIRSSRVASRRSVRRP